MAYRADIEIGVRGARDLEQLRSLINQTARAVDSLNDVVGQRGRLVQSIQNYTDSLDRAAQSLKRVGAGTEAETKAIQEYVHILGQTNAARERQNNLIEEQIRLQQTAARTARLAAGGVRENPNQYAGPIGPGAASPVVLSSKLYGRLEQAIEAQVTSLTNTAKQLNLKSSWNTFFEEATQLATELKQTATAKQLNLKSSWNTFFEEATQLATELKQTATAKQLNLKSNWSTFFEEAAQLATELKQTAAAKQLNLKSSWGTFFEEAAQLAVEIKAAAQRASAEIRASEGAASAAARERLAAAATERRAGVSGVVTRPIAGAAYATPAGPGGSGVTRASAVAASAAVERQVAQTRRAEAQAELKVIKDRGIAENYITGVLNRRLAAKAKELALEKEQTAEVTKRAVTERRSGGIGGRVGGAISGSIIGGAFPLLFGQGGGAAAGGAIGGLVGGLAGPGGSFAGSLLGTLLGDIASKGQTVKQLGEDIGFSTQQTKQLSDAFKVANTDVDKFTAVIQNIRGVGLAIEDQAKAIQLVTRLTEAYGGSFEKTGNAITSTLESGKVTQATLNQLTSQGIDIQQALADKYNVSRSELLQMAKDGEISAQSLIDTLVEVANAGTTGATKIKSSYEETATAMNNAFANATAGINASFTTTQNTVVSAFDRMVKAMSPVLVELAKITGQIVSLGVYAVELGVKFASAFYSIPGAIQSVATALGNLIPGLSTVYTTISAIRNLTGGGGGNRGLATSLNLNAGMGGANWPAGIPRPGTPVQSFRVPSEFGPTGGGGGGGGSKGPKPPEDKSAQMREDLKALELMSLTQDGIRDALFEGNKQLAIRLEYDQKVADINRDTAKALLNANYETEKAVIRAQEIVRIKDAQLERDDELRQLARDINEIITNTLDDLRGGVSWDDTGMREIFDMRIPDAIEEIKETIRGLTDPTNQIIGAASAIGDAFASSFSSIVSGAVSAREGLANFFKSVGDYFIDMSARIIAEALKLQAIQLLQSLLSPLLGSFGTGSMSLPGLEGAGALSNGPIYPGGVFAEGGVVTRPTMGLIGEGGEPEYVIPASKMRGAMSRYAAGTRGSAVIPAGGDGSEPGAPGAGGTATLDVRYTVERINSVDYVTADQFQAGMRQAASQGAERGQQLALRRLQQSPSTRRRIGL